MKMGIAEVLLVVFIILKLCNVIDWSWWWVLSPLWIVILWAILLVIIKSYKEARKPRTLYERLQREMEHRDRIIRNIKDNGSKRNKIRPND